MRFMGRLLCSFGSRKNLPVIVPSTIRASNLGLLMECPQCGETMLKRTPCLAADVSNWTSEWCKKHEGCRKL